MQPRPILPVFLAVLGAALAYVGLLASRHSKPSLPASAIESVVRADPKSAEPDRSPTPPPSPRFASPVVTSVAAVPPAPPALPLPATADLEPAFTAFHRWLESRLLPHIRDDETAGLELARRRRDELIDLIQSNPRRALELALPDDWSALLPASMRGFVEERVAGTGDLEVLCAYPEPGNEHLPHPIQRFAVIRERRWEAFVHGERLGEPTLRGVPIRGIAVGNLLAVEGDSGLAEAGAGGGSVLAESPATEGLKSLLFIRVDFDDLTGEPFSADRAAALARDVHRFYQDNSYGRAGFLEIGAGSAVTPVFRMTRSAASYGGQNDPDDLRRDARAAAAAAGYVLSDFDYDIICIRSVPGFGWSGLGYVGAPGAWIRGTSSTGVTAHELGHNFGLNHANFWDTGGDSVGGSGESVEYGDKFDTMGAASAGANHFNARYKRLLDWLQPGEFTVATTNGVYRIYAHDQTNAVAGSRGLQVFANARTNYWVEFRQRFSANTWMMNGAGLRWTGRGNESSLLLDTTPGSSREKDDSPLALGRTYSDFIAGVHLTPIARGDSTPAWLDVLVQRGSFPDNRQPTLTLHASPSDGSTTTQFEFSADASDPDNDDLSYHWDFSDESPGENAPSVTHRWSTTGEYRVQCTVSDGRGGVARASTVVRVGNPSTFRLSGAVTRDGEPQGGIRIGTGQGRLAYTDSDGTYTLTSITRGTYTLTATTSEGERWEPRGFSNPVNVTGSRADLDFANPVSLSTETLTLLPGGATWHYWDAESIPGDSWTQPDFDDSAWNVGAAILGYGGDRETTVVSFGPSSSQKRLTTWFRRNFVVENPSSLSKVTLALLRDDGAVVHLNGTELLRDNMPSGTITSATRAASTVGGTDELTYFEHIIEPSLLLAGTNLLAVEVHQASPTSSDTAFDLRLLGEVSGAFAAGVRLLRPADGDVFSPTARVVLTAAVGTPGDSSVQHVTFYAGEQVLGVATRSPYTMTWNSAPAGEHVLTAVATLDDGTQWTSAPIRIRVDDPALNPTLIPLGALWRYLDSGSAPAAGWTGLNFDDGSWKEGPARLGYGEDGEFTVVDFGSDPEDRHVTTWFRHNVNVPDASSVTNLTARLQRDDGAAVYLNGTEVARVGLRAGVLTPSLTALQDVRNEAEQLLSSLSIDPALLREGLNTVAAEVHQVNRTSTDLGFDLELTARRRASASPPPSLSWRSGPDSFVLRWPVTSDGWRLQSSPTLLPPIPWSPVPGAPAAANGFHEQAVAPEPAFYRLIREATP